MLYGRFTCNQIKVNIFGIHFFLGVFSLCLKSGQNRTSKKSNKINQSVKNRSTASDTALFKETTGEGQVGRGEQ